LLQRKYKMSALHELEVPIAHQDWSHDKYAAEVIRSLSSCGVLEREDMVRESLARSVVTALEWAKRNQWPISESFGLNLKWERYNLSYLIVRTTGIISQVHQYALYNNPIRAVEFLNYAVAHIEDYTRFQRWPLVDDIYAYLNSDHR